MQKQLDDIFANLARTEFAGRLSAWEILTVSESDAAFIGYLSMPEAAVKANKDYVIVDVGKGTTDFSVVHTGMQNVLDIQPVYRNGFAGAGNLITHAIFETLLHFIREQSAESGSTMVYIKEKLLAALSGSDLRFKNEFFSQIERLKFNFRDGSSDETRKQWTGVMSGAFSWKNIAASGNEAELSTIMALLKRMVHSADLYNYVENVCQAISEKIVAHLALVQKNKSGFDCDGIILTGRGFLFKPLERLVKQKIVSTLGIAEQKIVMLVGNELKDVCIKGVFDTSIKINAEAVGHPIQMVRNSSAASSSSLSANISDKIGAKWWQKLFLNSVESDMQQNIKHIVYDSQLNFQELSNSQIAIGCNVYHVAENSIFNTQQGIHYSASIDFTSEGYVVRRNNGSIVDAKSALLLVPEYTTSDKRMVIPSLFPNYVLPDQLESLMADVQPVDVPMQTASHASPTNTPVANDGANILRSDLNF
jgi:hypothetical protein